MKLSGGLAGAPGQNGQDSHIQRKGRPDGEYSSDAAAPGLGTVGVALALDKQFRGTKGGPASNESGILTWAVVEVPPAS